MVEIEILTSRLSFIKYLYESGKRQLEQPDPLSSIALLSFHDSVELFVQLLAEHIDAKTKKDMAFLDYWVAIKDKTGNELSHKESMRRLNQSRVSLKHFGNQPHRSALEEYSETVYSFFIDNCQLYFGISFDSISMINIIQCSECREQLTLAEEYFSKGNFSDATKSLAFAFECLINDYISRKETQYGKSPFAFGAISHFQSAFFMHIEGELGHFIDNVNDSLSTIQKAMRIMSLDINYRKYTKFSLLTPSIIHMAGGNIRYGKTPDLLSEADMTFCKNFIIESALKLQEFDYRIVEG